MCSRSKRGLLLSLLLLSVTCSSEQQLDRKLRSRDPTERAEAARLLGEGRGKVAHADQKLIALLDDPAHRVREAAARSLGLLRVAAAAKPLSVLLRDPKPPVRLAAVLALKRLGRRQAVDYLLDAVDDKNRQVRRAARFALEDLGVGRAEQVRRLALKRQAKLRRRLLDRLPSRRASALNELGRSGRQAIVDDLIRGLGDPYVDVALAAAEALGMVGGERALQSLRRVAGLGKHGESLSRHGMRSLLKHRRPVPAGVLDECLASPDESLREAALEYGLSPPPGVKRPSPVRLCRVLGSFDGVKAIGWARRFRRASVACPGGKPGEPLGPSWLTRPGPLTAAERRRLVTLLGSCASVRPLVLTVVALRAPGLHPRILRCARAAYLDLLRASERWLDEQAWQRIDRLAVHGSVAVRPPPTAPRTSRQKKLDQLARLLRRFPERRGEDLPELMPPLTGPAQVIAVVDVLARVEQAWPWLAGLAREAPLAVRLAALAALGRSKCGTDACQKALAAGLAHRRKEIRQAAATALGQRPGVATAALVGLLADPDGGVRGAAALSLARTRAKGAFETLRKAFRKGREEHLVTAFGVLGDPRAEPILLGLLREEHSPLRTGERLAVLESLEKLGTARAVERVTAELDHPAPAIRAAAARLAGRLGSARALPGLAVCANDYYYVVRDACRRARAQLKSPSKPSR